MATEQWKQDKIGRYLACARQALDTGEFIKQQGDYTFAVNRAYFAMFYAANALLTTKGLQQNKHVGLLADFRQHFVKTGIMEPKYGETIGRALDDRLAGDEALQEFGQETAADHLTHAESFVRRVEEVLAVA